MSGIGELVAFVKILKWAIPFFLTVCIAIGGWIIKYLSDIKSSSKQTQAEMHSFQIEFKSEISNIKNRIELMDSKLKDSYTRAESDNKLLQLENRLTSKIYEVLNKRQQTSRSKPTS